MNQGYLGYMNLGYTAREVELFVWLEVLRDKQCQDRPCEIGVLLKGKPEPKGGCPVKIHIPEMLDLLGQGKFRQALELIESCNPLPNVTGRVCPQELQCQGVCTHTRRPIEIGQLEWYPAAARQAGEPGRRRGASPARAARGPGPTSRRSRWWAPGPSGLINAYLLAAEGFPVTVFEAFHELGGVLRYGIPEFRLPNDLIDDVVGKITLLGGRFVRNFVVGKTATLEDLKAAGLLEDLRRHRRRPADVHERARRAPARRDVGQRVPDARQPDAGASTSKYETPLPETRGKQVIIIGGGNTAMDAARTARRLGANVTIVYRRTTSGDAGARRGTAPRAGGRHHSSRSCARRASSSATARPTSSRHAVLDVNELGPPDASGRRSPVKAPARPSACRSTW